MMHTRTNSALNPVRKFLLSYLWHPTGWSADCWELQGSGWRKSDVLFAVRLDPPRWWCESTVRREKTTKQGGKLKQERHETEVIFSTQIHSMGTRKWEWKALYVLHFMCDFQEEGWIEGVCLKATETEGFLWKCTSKGPQSQRDKKLLPLESWHSNAGKKTSSCEKCKTIIKCLCKKLLLNRADTQYGCCICSEKEFKCAESEQRDTQIL